ncbi:fumarylacetoacetate hydrolase family protein [Thiothrix subterranea]|uniref:Fumarylacetoacetate hydrolase family protein n=1 Tax=Thiothrix subterranea TaxID=2735563 RepID=A0AA51MPK5_9GAMM|nr:fumarylacetoacetate hydrolase family protein [Thiothrix subterranea]MDQ5768220.1 fumarylacetoacetate hydrolase family protein [Thiothrix subterranea]WML87748.1 fumarylacetoacetate hydrolase family protein [Thiothrix subterranea]
MKLGTCQYQHQTYVCIAAGDQILIPALDLSVEQSPWRDMITLIERGVDFAAVAANATPVMRVPATAITLLAPIPRPRKNVMCLGLNYLEHAQETANQIGRTGKAPQYPIVFTKCPTSVIGHEAAVPFDPDTCSQLDWEAELGVVLGKGGKKIARDNALAHVFGYTVINDLSARDIQLNHKQYFLGKSIDGGCPMGPWIVTADEIADPQALNIACRVNGVTKQASNTRQMIFDVASIIEWLSRGMTLEAGDVIATGTPSGVGFVREPPEYLLPGDVVECEVEGVGVLRNTIVD